MRTATQVRIDGMHRGETKNERIQKLYDICYDLALQLEVQDRNSRSLQESSAAQDAKIGEFVDRLLAKKAREEGEELEPYRINREVHEELSQVVSYLHTITVIVESRIQEEERENTASAARIVRFLIDLKKDLLQIDENLGAVLNDS
ncbi:hypothetical protein HN911_13400 [Candidatus Bathyarchaeota archaeon]|jgi:hypothetical protein|nr:hypothetical protein [Candidatus Bathyarchaeota archaeon]